MTRVRSRAGSRLGAVVLVLGLLTGPVLLGGVAEAGSVVSGRTDLGLDADVVDLAADPASGTLLTASYDTTGAPAFEQVTVLAEVDPVTGSSTALLTVPGSPDRVALDPTGQTIYVATTTYDPVFASTLSVIDRSSLSVRSTVALGGRVTDLVVDGPGGRLYVSGGGARAGEKGAVTVIDTATDQAVERLLTDGTAGVLALDPASSTLWVAGDTGSGDDSVPRTALVDTTTGTVRTVLPDLSIGAIDPSRGLAYLYEGRFGSSDTVVVVDTSTLARVGVIPGVLPGLVDIDAASQTMFVSAPLAQTFDVVDLTSRSRTARVTDTPGYPQGRALDTDRRAYYVVGGSSSGRRDVSRYSYTPVASPPPACPDVVGLIGEKFAQLGGCDGALGRPTSTEQDVPGGEVTHFEHGDVYFSPATGAHAVLGVIAARYRDLGAASSRLGFPTTDELDVLIGRASVFQRGFIFWNPLVGALAFGA